MKVLKKAHILQQADVRMCVYVVVRVCAFDREDVCVCLYVCV